MNIFFTGSITSHVKNRENYAQIVRCLKASGHCVIADHILQITEDEVSKKSRDERLGFHKQVEEWIQSCHCVVAETTIPSVSVGYEIALAARLGIPVLILHSSGEGPSLLTQHKSEHIVVEKYTAHSLPVIIADFLGFVKDNRDVKFTFYLSHKYFMYLDDTSKNQQMSKSAYLRKLIEEDMRNSLK